MGSTAASDSASSQIYGVPLYGASWVPHGVFKSKDPGDDATPPDSAADASSSSASASASSYILFAGGGGEGRSGIPNELLIASFDFASVSLSEQPVARLGTGQDLPYRIAIHPRGEEIICSFPKNCRVFRWEKDENGEISLKLSDIIISQLEDVGQQLALTFSKDGSLLAIGGEDGYLRVFKWSGMEIILNQERAHASVKDLDFSQDGKFLVSVGGGGPCRVWDMSSPQVVTSLPKENDEVFGFCRFSHREDKGLVLYTITIHGKGVSIVTWNTSSWRRISSKLIARDPVSAFDVSVDGKFLAIGTISGDILVINSANMRVQMSIKKAHLGLVTRLMFSNDAKALVSTSMDSSARVTTVKDKVVEQEGFNYWIIILVFMLAIIAYVIKAKWVIA